MTVWEAIFAVLAVFALMLYYSTRRTRNHLRENAPKMLADIARRIGHDNGLRHAKEGNPYDDEVPFQLLKRYYQ